MGLGGSSEHLSRYKNCKNFKYISSLISFRLIENDINQVLIPNQKPPDNCLCRFVRLQWVKEHSEINYCSY